MASINISEDEGWVGAAWVLRSIANGLQQYGNFPSLDQDFAAVEGGVQYLDLSELNESERAELRRVAPLILSEVKKAGPSMLTDPKFYPGFVTALEEFEQLVTAAASK
ncbi:MAG: hypothetical protein WAK03_06765 [Methylocystis sp.]|jgi:hypothetical protein